MEQDGVSARWSQSINVYSLLFVVCLNLTNKLTAVCWGNVFSFLIKLSSLQPDVPLEIDLIPTTAPAPIMVFSIRAVSLKMDPLDLYSLGGSCFFIGLHGKEHVLCTDSIEI